MKKRILSLVLCFVMVLPVLLFTGCAKASGDEEDTSDVMGTTESARLTQTFVMYVMKEEGTSEAQENAVEEAINKITKAKFKTQLDIRFLTEDEYYEKLEAEIVAMKELQDKQAEENKNTKPVETTEDEETTEEETILNEYGLPEYKYPAVEEHQVDIFFFGGYERYLEYVEKDWLMSMDAELDTNSKKLLDYINYTYISAADLAGSIYAMPNNRVMGEYTYLLLNKEMMDKYSYAPSDITSLVNAEAFLNDIKNNESDRFDPLAYDSHKEPTLFYYWNINPETLEWDHETFSIVGTAYSAGTTFTIDKYYKENKTEERSSQLLSFQSLLDSNLYREQLLKLKYYEFNGYYAEENSEKEFAVSVVKGDARLADTYSDKYYVNVIDYPRVTTDEIFDSMFGICSYSKGTDARLMEIITYLNTNPDLRNLLQYGIENINYTVNEDGTIKRTDSNEYFMDINKTGNVFVAYPEEYMQADEWEYGKKQNLDAKIDCTLGFKFGLQIKEDNITINTDAIKDVYDASIEVKKTLDSITNYDDFVAKLDEYRKEYSASKLGKYVRNGQEAEGEAKYPFTIYFDWCIDSGYVNMDED